MKNKTYLYIGTGALLLAFFVLGNSLYKRYQNNNLSFIAKENSAVFIREHSPRYGSPEAKVFLIEFLDPECESCRMFYPHLKRLIGEYEDRVQLVVRYAPFHGNSRIAIAALEATKAQGKYWEALEVLFERQPEWGNHHHPKIEKIFDILPTVGVDVDKMKIEMRSPQIQSIIEQDESDLKVLGVRATPTFFVNGKKPAGFGYRYLKELIDEEIKRLY